MHVYAQPCAAVTMSTCDLFTIGKEDLLSALDGYVDVQVKEFYKTDYNYVSCEFNRSGWLMSFEQHQRHFVCRVVVVRVIWLVGFVQHNASATMGERSGES